MLDVMPEVFNLDAVSEVAKKLLGAAGECRVWLWQGEMGAGKTTMIKAVCQQLGVKGTMASPTFSIVNEYTTDRREAIYHFDFYRLKNENEALDIGVEEYLDSGAYCFLEWPDRISSLLPDRYFSIQLAHQSANSRTIEYHTHE